MTTAESKSTIADQTLEAAKQKKIDAIENVWIEFIGAAPADADYYKELIPALGRLTPKTRVEELVQMLAEQLAERAQWDALYRVIQLGAKEWPENAALADLAPKCLAQKFSDREGIEDIIRATKLGDGATLEQGIKRFRSFLRLGPGQVFQHKTWGEGIVRSLDIPATKIVLDFPTEKNKTITFAGVKNFLTWIKPEHFYARRVREPEALWELGQDSPAELVRLAVEAAGGKVKQTDLKTMLNEVVVPKEKWNSWWGKARSALKLDSMIDFDAKGGAHAEIILRSEPKSFEEEIEDAFLSEDADTPTRIEALVRTLDAQKKMEIKPKLPRQMLKHLSEVVHINPDLPVEERLQMACMVEDIKSSFSVLKDENAPLPPSEEIASKIQDYMELNGVSHVPYAMRALKVLLKRDGDAGLAKAVEILPRADARLAQAIWRELDEEHHIDLAVKALEALFDNALNNPETYLWAVKAIADGGWNHLDDYFPATWAAMHLLGEMEVWQEIVDEPRSPKDEVAAAKTLLSRARAILQARNHAVLCAAVEQVPLEQAQRIRRSVEIHKALPDAWKSSAMKQFRLTRRDLEDQVEAPEDDEEKFHYCTARMRAEKMIEMTEINTVTIPANSREIEDARQEGDLRENAGYHAAKDKQKMLMQRSLQLQQALATARVMDASQVRTDAVGFGTRVETMNLKESAPETFTILGRWEADPDKHILSYLAPMVQQFLGRKVGEELVIKHPGGGETPYKVVSITNALSSGDWDEPKSEG